MSNFVIRIHHIKKIEISKPVLFHATNNVGSFSSCRLTFTCDDGDVITLPLFADTEDCERLLVQPEVV